MSVQYISPNMEQTLYSGDNSILHTFMPSRKYILEAYNHAYILIRTEEHPNERFVIDVGNFSSWANTTGSGCEIG